MGKVVMIALDHARMNGLVNGLHDQKRVIEAVIEGGADAIMTSYGNIKNFGYLMNGKVSKILRLDTGREPFHRAVGELHRMAPGIHSGGCAAAWRGRRDHLFVPRPAGGRPDPGGHRPRCGTGR